MRVYSTDLISYLSCQMLSFIFLCTTTLIPVLAYPSATLKPISNEEKCLAKNVEYLQVLCTYQDKNHPCFTGTILYQDRPIHLLNMEGVAAHLCTHGTQIDVAASYCCFTEKCLKLCYEKVEYEKLTPAH